MYVGCIIILLGVWIYGLVCVCVCIYIYIYMRGCKLLLPSHRNVRICRSNSIPSVTECCLKH